jgi:hypothetical protein
MDKAEKKIKKNTETAWWLVARMMVPQRLANG